MDATRERELGIEPSEAPSKPKTPKSRMNLAKSSELSSKREEVTQRFIVSRDGGHFRAVGGMDEIKKKFPDEDY